MAGLDPVDDAGQDPLDKELNELMQMEDDEQSKQAGSNDAGEGASLEENLGDRTLALTLHQAIAANCQIEGLN